MLFADDTSIIVTACNVKGGTDKRMKLNGSARNGSKLKALQYVDICNCKNFTSTVLLPINSNFILTQISTMRYLPQNAVCCTTPVYCYLLNIFFIKLYIWRSIDLLLLLKFLSLYLKIPILKNFLKIIILIVGLYLLCIFCTVVIARSQPDVTR